MTYFSFARLLLCVSMCLFIGFTFVFGETREWVDVQGRSITGDLISQTQEAVVLKVDGKEYTIPLATLSETDRDYLERRQLLTFNLQDMTFAEYDMLKTYDTKEEANQAAQELSEKLAHITGIPSRNLTENGILVHPRTDSKPYSLELRVSYNDADGFGFKDYSGRVYPDIISTDTAAKVLDKLKDFKSYSFDRGWEDAARLDVDKFLKTLEEGAQEAAEKENPLMQGFFLKCSDFQSCELFFDPATQRIRMIIVSPIDPMLR